MYAYKTHFTIAASFPGSLFPVPRGSVACFSLFRKHRSTRARQTTCRNCMRTHAWKKAMRGII